MLLKLLAMYSSFGGILFDVGIAREFALERH